MMVTYDEMIQGFYTRYQNGYSCYNQFKNCFVDIKEYQDLISDIFLRFHSNQRYRLRYDSGQITPSLLKSQFKTAIQRGAIDAYRRKSRRGTEPLENFEEYKFGKIDMEFEELFHQAHEILRDAGLTTQETAIFLDIHYWGSSQSEVAEMHGISDRTVRNKLTSASNKLRRLTANL